MIDIFLQYSKNLVKRYDFSINDFISNFYILFLIIYNFYFLLIIFPPYGVVKYGVEIYEFKATNLSEFDDKLLFILSFFIIPLLYSFKKFIDVNTRSKLINIFFLLFLFLNFVLFFKLLLFFFKINFQISFTIEYFFIIISEIIIFIILNKNYSKIKKKLFYNLKKFYLINLFLLGVNFIFYKPLDLNFTFDNFNKSNFLYYFDLVNFLSSYTSILLFTLFSFLILTFFFKYKLLQSMENRFFSYSFLILIIIFSITLFESSIEFNIHHYAPIFGPTLHFINGGGILGYDVFSQYGYFFIYMLSFIFKLLPESFGTTAFLIRLINLLTIIIFILIFYKISKFKIFGTLLAFIFIIIHLKFAPVNFASFPSLLGMRNFIPLLAIFVVITLNNKIFLKLLLINILLCISSITSIEVFLYTFVPFLTVTLATSLNNKDSFKRSLKFIFLSISIILIFHLIINLTYFLKYDVLIRYEIYLEMFDSMVSGNWWPIPTIQYFILPFFFFTIYSLSLIYCISLIKKSYYNLNIFDSKEYLSFFIISVYGVLSMLYYVSRSVPGNLQVTSLPMYLLLYLILEKLIINYKFSNYFKTSLTIIFLFLSFQSSIFLSENSYQYKNGKNLLSDIFLGKLNISNYFKKLTNTYHNYPEGSREYDILSEAISLIDREYKNQKLILLFTYDGLSGIPEIVFSMTKKWYFNPISYTFSDELSQQKVKQILEKNNVIKQDDKIAVLNSGVHRLEQQVINDIEDKWNLCILNKNYKYFTVYSVSKNVCIKK